MMTTFSSMHPDTRPPLGVLKMLVVQSDPHGCPHGEHATCASELLFLPLSHPPWVLTWTEWKTVCNLLQCACHPESGTGKLHLCDHGCNLDCLEGGTLVQSGYEGVPQLQWGTVDQPITIRCTMSELMAGCVNAMRFQFPSLPLVLIDDKFTAFIRLPTQNHLSPNWSNGLERIHTKECTALILVKNH